MRVIPHYSTPRNVAEKLPSLKVSLDKSLSNQT